MHSARPVWFTRLPRRAAPVCRRSATAPTPGPPPDTHLLAPGPTRRHHGTSGEAAPTTSSSRPGSVESSPTASGSADGPRDAPPSTFTTASPDDGYEFRTIDRQFNSVRYSHLRWLGSRVIIAKFHYTRPTGPDRTRPDKVRGLCRRPRYPDLRQSPLGPRGSPTNSADFCLVRSGMSSGI